MAMRVDDFDLKLHREPLHWGEGSELVPHCKLTYSDVVVAEYVGWSVPHALRAIRDSFGEPPWRPPLLINVRCVRCDCGRNCYVIELE